MPKKRRRVLPVEQPRNRKREVTVQNRRTNALKHQHTHPTIQTHQPVLKDAFGSAKSGHVNGVNVIGLSAQNSASPSNQPTSTSMSAKMASMTGGSCSNTNQSQCLTGAFSLLDSRIEFVFPLRISSLFVLGFSIKKTLFDVKI